MTKTWHRVSERFYWKGMSQQVREVEHCDKCLRMNKKIDTIRPELHPVPVKSPWYHLGIDFIGPISPLSASGNSSDYFTKFAFARAHPWDYHLL